MKEQNSQNFELIFVIIIIFVIMATYYYYLYREYTKKQEALTKSKIIPQCPDYWKSIGNNKCQNIKNIGRCNLGSINEMDFSEKLYAEDVNKCKWSKFCEASWEGIDNLCV
jgi:hypothetical protein